MSNTNLRFQRINDSTIGSFKFTPGTIYFNDADNLIYVGTGDGTGTSYCKVYSGARDINWDNANSILSFTNAGGTSVSIDFDNLVGFGDFAALRDGIGLVESKVGDTSVYSFGAGGIVDTSYLANSDSSTVIGALKSLDNAVSIARQNAGVISFGGKTGVISVKSDNTSTGYINFSMDGSTLNASIADPSSAAYKTVEYFVGTASDTSANNTIKGAINYTKDVLGTTNDTSAATTVYGARQKAEDVKTELLGTDSDSSAMVTIYGVQQKAEDIYGSSTNDTSASKTIEGLVKKTDEMKTNAALHLYSGAEGTTAVTEVKADGTTYRLVQGTTEVARFNIEKDSFVKEGSVVNVPDTSAHTSGYPDDPGWYIRLVIKTTDDVEETVLWIPAESLVDAYTADNGSTGSEHNVTVTVNNIANTISATVATSAGTSQVNFNSNNATTLATIAGQPVTIKLDTLEPVAENTVGGVQLSESNNVLSARLQDNTVTTAKIVNDSVTTAKLDSSVRTSLGKANTAIQTVSGQTAVSDSSYVAVSVEASTNDRAVTLTSHANVTVQDVSTSANSTAMGLAEAYNVKDYVQKYVGEQLTWTVWPSQA